uniref:Uncharacterized protein n=1 Tax=viral metagenome TaxID=1070528 RepID=A0A6C0EAC8_9ZZZZ
MATTKPVILIDNKPIISSTATQPVKAPQVAIVNSQQPSQIVPPIVGAQPVNPDSQTVPVPPASPTDSCICFGQLWNKIIQNLHVVFYILVICFFLLCMGYALGESNKSSKVVIDNSKIPINTMTAPPSASTMSTVTKSVSV